MQFNCLFGFENQVDMFEIGRLYIAHNKRWVGGCLYNNQLQYQCPAAKTFSSCQPFSLSDKKGRAGAPLVYHCIKGKQCYSISFAIVFNVIKLIFLLCSAV